MNRKTDWTKYYESPYKTASVTRKITARVLTRGIRKYLGDKAGLSLIELGGANSAFLEDILEAASPSGYLIIDNNDAGIEKTRLRIKDKKNVKVIKKDILSDLEDIEKADLVLSTGLIEHFDKAGTRKAIEAHFALTKPGGIVIMTYPTPTVLYKIVRYFAEKLKVWIFHDERPLLKDEVLKAVGKNAELKAYQIIWPILLTQGYIVFKKTE